MNRTIKSNFITITYLGCYINITVQKELDDGDTEQYERRIEEYEKSYDTTKIMFYEFNDDHFKIPLEVWSKLYKCVDFLNFFFS